MKYNDYLNQIGDLVGKDKLEEAIRELTNLFNGSPKLTEVYLHSGKLTELKNQIRKGIISFDQASISKNKIRLAILQLTQELEEIAEEDEAIKKEVENFLTEEKLLFKLNQAHYGKGDIIGRDKIVYQKKD